MSRLSDPADKATLRIAAHGHRVIRVRNDEVLSNLEGVLQHIRTAAAIDM